MHANTDEYQRITIGYKEDAKRLGTGAATEQWCKTLFDAWMYSLDSETDKTSDETKRRLTALMRADLHVRDALVASIIDPTLDVDAMLAIAVRPDDKSAKNYLSTLLSTTLDNATNGKAPWCNGRFDAAIDMLSAMAETASKRFAAQPLAVIAYVSWLAGARNAAILALQALVYDKDCTLASIVFWGVQRNLIPVRQKTEA